MAASTLFSPRANSGKMFFLTMKIEDPRVRGVLLNRISASVDNWGSASARCVRVWSIGYCGGGEFWMRSCLGQ
ncbi:uncharacterized protein LAJ45_04985 [Morchella importuna]|uniref:uncharacterized protein n=1 Tax=Morchella importuna TaxID=1174673 RepID=UPI001E8D8DFE|nr:uncharacterized protein LAJ45_04985 [Morchella importuna]KAH8150804.1 hypothetical protein LAJ45_04985 [Morchella importuna]